MAEEWITASQAAGRLGVTDARIRQLILEGSLPAQKFGRAHMIRVRDLDRFERPKMGRPPKPKPEEAAAAAKKARKKGTAK